MMRRAQPDIDLKTKGKINTTRFDYTKNPHTSVHCPFICPILILELKVNLKQGLFEENHFCVIESKPQISIM